MFKKLFIATISLIIIFSFVNSLSAQNSCPPPVEMPYYNDFSCSDLSNWEIHGFSTGLYGDYKKPYVQNGRLFIATRDQQSVRIFNGADDWSNYTIEADVRIEQPYDDAYQGIRTHFYVQNVNVLADGPIAWDGYCLDFEGRNNTWKIDHRKQSSVEEITHGNVPAPGLQVGVDYHEKIVIKGRKVSIYFNKLGSSPYLLTEFDLPSDGPMEGKFGFGGADDLISIDNVSVQNTCPPVEMPYYNDFSCSDLSNWEIHGFSTGLYGDYKKPYVQNGRLFIATRDQQSVRIFNGADDWSNYTIEADVRIEQPYDDAYQGIRTHFYVQNVNVLADGPIAWDGYCLDFEGRNNTWKIDHRKQSSVEEITHGNVPAPGLQVGVDYHEKIVIKGRKVSIYFNKLGSSPYLLTEFDLPSDGPMEGKFGFGGADDLISIDNVSVQNSSFLQVTSSFSQMPKEFHLFENYPNPFNPTTTISYNLPEIAPVQMNVFDVLGTHICTLVNRRQGAGHYSISWDGRDEQHRDVPSGIYICQLKAGKYVASRKMLLVR